jgi:hypothetical protein
MYKMNKGGKGDMKAMPMAKTKPVTKATAKPKPKGK